MRSKVVAFHVYASWLLCLGVVFTVIGCGGKAGGGSAAPPTPTLTWATPGAITYGTALGGSQLDATASVAGSFVYSPAAGTTPKAGTQTLSATFTPTDTTIYTTATATVQLVVNQATPTVTWPTPAAITYGTALSGTQLDATASAPGSFVYSPAAGTTPKAGTQTLSVTFTPSDTTTYTTATASVKLVVNQAMSTITWATPAAITYGTALSGTQLDATASVPGTFVYTPASGTTPKAGTQTLSVTFTPSDTTTYTTATASVKLVVNQAMPTVTWPTPADIIAGAALTSTQLDATASVPGTFVYNPAAGAILAQGSQTLFVSFTPTDATDYVSVTTSVDLVVDPSVPTITGITPRYIALDTFPATSPFTITAIGVETGDLFHNIQIGSILPIAPDLVDPYPTGTTSFGISAIWQQGTFEPLFDMFEIQHPNGPYVNQWSLAFLGSGSQSTLAVSPTTGTIFQVAEAESQGIHTLKTDGTTGVLSASGLWVAPFAIAIDDVTGDLALGNPSVVYSSSDIMPSEVNVFDESGNKLCYLKPSDMTTMSSVAAMGGYMVFTDPADNLVGIAKMDCSGYHSISVAGQPWAVAMVNGAELDAYVLSRGKWSSNGLPGLTKIKINSDGTTTVEGSVELTGFIPVSTIRATNQYAGIYQVQAFTKTATAAVLYMSDATDGIVLTISTDTSSGKTMAIAHSTPIQDLPIGIAVQETASSSTLWVASISASSGEAVTHIGGIDPTTGNYVPDVGSCTAGVLAGGFIATSNGVYCAQGGMIQPPLVLSLP
jgi:hypothetical protein